MALPRHIFTESELLNFNLDSKFLFTLAHPTVFFSNFPYFIREGLSEATGYFDGISAKIIFHAFVKKTFL